MAPGPMTSPTAQHEAVRALASKLLAVVTAVAATCTDSDLRTRAQVLIAHVDLEAIEVVKRMRREAFCGKHRVSIEVCGCPFVDW